MLSYLIHIFCFSKYFYFGDHIKMKEHSIHKKLARVEEHTHFKHSWINIWFYHKWESYGFYGFVSSHSLIWIVRKEGAWPQAPPRDGLGSPVLEHRRRVCSRPDWATWGKWSRSHMQSVGAPWTQRSEVGKWGGYGFSCRKSPRTPDLHGFSLSSVSTITVEPTYQCEGPPEDSWAQDRTWPGLALLLEADMTCVSRCACLC